MTEDHSSEPAAMVEPTPKSPQDGSIGRSLTASAGWVTDAIEIVQTVGGPAAIATAAGVTAKHVIGAVRDITVAKIQANAQVEVARIRNGYQQEGGAHRADD